MIAHPHLRRHLDFWDNQFCLFCLSSYKPKHVTSCFGDEGQWGAGGLGNFIRDFSESSSSASTRQNCSYWIFWCSVFRIKKNTHRKSEMLPVNYVVNLYNAQLSDTLKISGCLFSSVNQMLDKLVALAISYIFR